VRKGEESVTEGAGKGGGVEGRGGGQEGRAERQGKTAEKRLLKAFHFYS
jgi:hypothetical protein